MANFLLCLCILAYFAGHILGQEKNPDDERLASMSPEEFLEHLNSVQFNSGNECDAEE